MSQNNNKISTNASLIAEVNLLTSAVGENPSLKKTLQFLQYQCATFRRSIEDTELPEVSSKNNLTQ